MRAAKQNIEAAYRSAVSTQNAALPGRLQHAHDIFQRDGSRLRPNTAVWIVVAFHAGEVMDEDVRSVRGYRARAKQIRDEAASMPNLETRQALLEIAARYERLASRIEQNRNLC